MSRLDWRRHAPRNYARIVEAACYVTIARTAIRVLPFRHLTRAFERSVAHPALRESARRYAIADVRRAITAAASRLPGSTSCFARAVAAQAMLRRRGVRTTLFYGARTAHGRDLRAHVWLHAGDDAVVGQENAPEYTVVAEYSSGRSRNASTGGTR
jgi:hypothetical protein